MVKPETNKLPGKHRIRWKYNNKIDLKDTGRKVVQRIYLAQDRFKWLTVDKTIINFRLF
jgi:hypothetical protein